MRKQLIILAALFVVIAPIIHISAQNVTFHQNDQVVIKSGLSSVWLRSQPSSNCACVEYVISSSKRVLRILDNDPVSDGVQNWWHVSTVERPVKQGWVEEKSLRLLTPPLPTASLTPKVTQSLLPLNSTSAQIREGIPFVWLRNQPNSSAKTLQTIDFVRPTNQSQCLKIAQTGENRVWDGVQWWRLIRVTNTTTYGWVEETSLTACTPTSSNPTDLAVTLTSPAPASVGAPQAGITQSPIVTTYAAYQPFENGMMIWRQDTQMVYVLINGAGHDQVGLGTYSGWPVPADRPPVGRFTPVNAFGKVWNGELYFGTLIRDLLGWAIASEQGYTATITDYYVASVVKPDSHTLITLPDGRTVDMEFAFNSWNFK
ncbi:MAG: hypothetical protein GC179_18930 [Anaerolineaceae bacterium]|nr:hypothetical protein [Anaerolineaceae bacterium]